MTLSTSASRRLLSEAPALCDVIRDIHRRGWCDGTGGNFSSLLCRDPHQLLMAPSGIDKGSLQPQDLIVVDGVGEVIHGNGKASAETFLHLTILATTKATAVLHTHSQAATLLSRFASPIETGNEPIQTTPSLVQISEESINKDKLSSNPQAISESPRSTVFSPVPQASESEYAGPDDLRMPPSAPALLGRVRVKGLEMLKGLEGIESHNASIAIPVFDNSQDMKLLGHTVSPHLHESPYGVLIAGHGLYAWGNSLFQARRHLEILEFLLEQHWREALLTFAIRNTQLSPQ